MKTMSLCFYEDQTPIAMHTRLQTAPNSNVAILPEKGMLYSLSLSHWLLMLLQKTNGRNCSLPYIVQKNWVNRLIQDGFHHATSSDAQNTWVTMPWFPGQLDTICTSFLSRQCHSKQFFPWLKWKIRTWKNIAFVRRTCYDQTTVSMVPWWLQWSVTMGNQTFIWFGHACFEQHMHNMTSERLHAERPHLFWPLGWSVSSSTVGCHRGLTAGLSSIKKVSMPETKPATPQFFWHKCGRIRSLFHYHSLWVNKLLSISKFHT